MERLGKPIVKVEGYIAREPVLQKAFSVAQDAHNAKERADGTPFITHPLAVTRIMYEEWGITDPEMLAVGLLHDVPEDNTDIPLGEIGKIFGEKIKFWVDGVTKLKSEKGDKKSADKETLRKVFDKNLLDPFVGVVKLADRLHNMRTIQFLEPHKRILKSRETLDSYSPLAESLGMWLVKTELENLAFKYTDPELYERYSKLFNSDPRNNDPFRSYLRSRLENILNSSNIEGVVEIRENSLVRIKDKKIPFESINDVASFRVRVYGQDKITKRNECYKLLGILHEEFRDIEDQSRFDNFYSSPRSNGYSAIQITLDTPVGDVEIAITSDEKEDYNNWGVVSLMRKGERALHEYALKLVFTPTGQTKFLPPAANGLDLAYLINKKIAAQATGMLINGKELPISTVIPNGADVKILVGPDRLAPNKEEVELSLPSTKKAAEKQFLEEKMQEEEARGKEKVLKIISERGLLDLRDLTKLKEHSGKLGDFLNYSGSKRSLAILYRLVEYGVITDVELGQQLDAQGITKKGLGLTSILLEGIDNSELLSLFSAEIAKAGGNIRWNEGGSASTEKFSERFVVEGLSKEAERKLEEIFKKTPKVGRVLIV